ncbi:MAG: hypothetical protein LBD06_11475, partial [Candidatus Accumulibacter sp.]|nr:hypothetical protein [Accumulibacter sp.]
MLVYTSPLAAVAHPPLPAECQILETDSRHAPMPDTRHKTLGLPARADDGQPPDDPRRKPIRGMAGHGRRMPPKPKAAQPADADDAGKTEKIDWRKRSQARRNESRGGPPTRNARPAAVGASRGGHGESAPGPENPLAGVRVSKLMTERGLCSRREADDLIVRGWVYVDGERVARLGARADPSVKITLDAQARAMQQRQMTI